MLSVKVLGQFTLYKEQQLIPLPNRPAQALVAYLLIHDKQSFPREELAALFWPEVSDARARNNLRQTLWRVRQAVGSTLLKADRTTVSVDPAEDVDLDLKNLRQVVAASSSTMELLAASQNYSGELLPGFYEGWVISAREQANRYYEQLMEQLLDGLSYEGRWEEVLIQAEICLSRESTHEAAFRAIMTAYAALGNQKEMSATYQRCIALLRAELAVGPALETEALFQRLSSGVLPVVRSTNGRTPSLPDFLTDRSQSSTPIQGICVAREPQLEQLAASLSRTMAGQGAINLIAGEAGQGKSCLMREFARRAQLLWPDLVVAWGVGDLFIGSRDPFLPFRDILAMLTGAAEDALRAGLISHEGARRLWSLLPISTAALAGHGLDLVDTFVPGIPLRQRWQAHGMKIGRTETNLAIRVNRNATYGSRFEHEPGYFMQQYADVLKAIARQRPLLLLFDDLHWTDRASLELLGYLSRQLGHSRVMLLGSYRPEELALDHDPHQGPHPLTQLINEIKRRLGDVTLDLNVGAAAAGSFIDALIDSQSNDLGTGFRQLLNRHTEGHPLFVVELLRELQARGDLRQDISGNWVADPTLNLTFVPAQVEAIVEQRLGRLDPDLYQVLQVASLLGEQFNAEVVAAAMDVPGSQLVASLTRELVQRHRLLTMEEPKMVNGKRPVSRFRFRHQLYQNFLLNSLVKAERVYWHGRLADRLADFDGIDSAISPLQLAHHYRDAGAKEPAISHLLKAGMQATHVAAYEEATQHFQEAVDLLATLPHARERDPMELELLLSLGHCFYLTKGNTAPEALALLKRAERLAATLPDKEAQLRTLWQMWHYCNSAAEQHRALAIAREFVAIAQDAAPLTRQIGYYILNLTLVLTGNNREALAFCRQHSETMSDSLPTHVSSQFHFDGQVMFLNAMAQTLWMQGYPDESLRSSEKALARARSLGHLPTLLTILLHHRVIRLYRREWEAFAQLIEEGLALAQQYGIVSGIDGAGFHGALLIAKRGDPAGSIPLMEQALARNRAINLLSGHSWDLYYLAQTYVATGQYAKAEESLQKALAFANDSGECFYMAEILRAQGELSTLQGRPPLESEQFFQAALALTKQQGAKSLELRSAMSLARHWAVQGRTQQGYNVLQPIFAWFKEGFDTRDLLEARALLAELAA